MSAPIQPWASNLRSCGFCCFGFSLFAIVFLCVVGAVLNSGSETIAIDPAKRSAGASNCFVGAGIYAAFVVVSMMCIGLPPLLCPPKKRLEASESLMGDNEFRFSQ